MLFVKSEDLKQGMRLAKPIYNKNGVLLYERNTKLTRQGIKSINNFGLIGIYILEPAEPVPPMTEDDIEFERFQTVAVFAIRENMQELLQHGEPKNLMNLANTILKNYGKLYHKITFTQNLRSPEDYVYKHSLNVAILSALISHRLKLDFMAQLDTVMAALLHDFGKLNISGELAGKVDPDEREMEEIKRGIGSGYNMLGECVSLSSGAKRIISQVQRKIYGIGGGYAGREKKLYLGTRIIVVADAYDSMTAMKMDETPMSEVQALRILQEEDDYYEQKTVKGLMESIHIMPPGACVELENGEKGLVIRENENVLEPVVLTFGNNLVYDFSREEVRRKHKIVDIMKTMDNRIVIDKNLLESYRGSSIEFPASDDERL